MVLSRLRLVLVLNCKACIDFIGVTYSNKIMFVAHIHGRQAERICLTTMGIEPTTFGMLTQSELRSQQPRTQALLKKEPGYEVAQSVGSISTQS